jgi:hypothetical protein
MARKLVLCVSPAHLSAGLWTGRRLSAVHGFSDEQQDQQAFATFLRAARGVPVYIMADTVDEDYRFETLPHAFGKDRRDMLERKLKQLYRSTPLFGANLTQREETKRRDDRYLFAAVTNPEMFDPWLRVLGASQLPIAGIFPLPLVSLALIKQFDLKEQNLLLVSRHEAGVRQTFVKDGRFRISRLTPLRPGATGSSIESCAEEVRNTRMYLDALNVTHVDEVLNVVILDQDGSLAPLPDMVAQGKRNLRAVRIPPHELTNRIGVDTTALHASPDALHLFLLGQQKAPTLNMAPPSLTSGYTRLQLSRGLYALTGGAGALAAAWCGLNLYNVMGLEDEAHQISVKTHQEQRHYQDITRSFPPSPAASNRLQATVDVSERIGAMGRVPDTMFRVVSTGLDKYPAMRLTTLRWKYGRPGPEGAAAAAVPPAGAPTALSQSAVLGLELTAQPGDFKGALANITSFVRELSKSESVAEAKVVKMPLNLSSTATLTGSTASLRQEQPQSAQFDVEVRLKPGI